MVNSTWTSRHINRLLRPFTDLDDEDLGSDSEENEEEVDLVLEANDEVLLSGLEETQMRRRLVGRAKELEEERALVAERAEEKVEKETRDMDLRVGRVKRARTVYPPCDTISLASLPLEGREKIVLSLAQFRPEKDHQVQLHAFSTFLSSDPDRSKGHYDYRLILAGSVRNEGDEKRVEALRELAGSLGIQVSFEI
ncbi:hypothetical protein P7C70_g8854, partial [Phenoliferia sp. Uapishka_3]